MRTVGKRFARAQAGSALVEFAVLVPMLILLVIGIAEFGRFAYYSILVGNAARAGVQYGSQNVQTAIDATGMQTASLNDAQNFCSSMGSSCHLTATASYYCKCAGAGTSPNCLSTDCASSHRLLYVQVNTTGSFPSIFHYPGLPSTFSVSDEAVMRVVEQ